MSRKKGDGNRAELKHEHDIAVVPVLAPVREGEEAPIPRGRGDKAEFAGEMVQVLIDGGMGLREAREHVRERFAHRGNGIERESISAAHRRWKRAGQPSPLYQQFREHYEAAERLRATPAPMTKNG